MFYYHLLAVENSSLSLSSLSLSLSLFLSQQGLKTGMYYLRTRSAAAPIQFTVDQKVVQQAKSQKRETEAQKVEEDDRDSESYQEALLACSRENKEACIMCSA